MLTACFQNGIGRISQAIGPSRSWKKRIILKSWNYMPVDVGYLIAERS
jgi:hypothetical protein